MLTEVIIGCVLILLTYWIVTDKMPEGMPPGSWGLPIIGKMISPRISFPAQAHLLQEKYGKIFTWRIGSNVFVFLSDYKLIKEAYNNPLINSRVKVFPLSFMAGFHKAGFTNNDGPPLTNLRRFTMRFLKDNGMGKSSLEEYVLYEAECLVENFKKHTGTPTEIPWSVNVAVINILWQIVSDKRYDLENKEIEKLERLMTSLFKGFQSPKFLLFTFFPWLFHVIPYFVIKNIVYKEHFDKLKIYKRYFKKCIKEHQKNLDDEEPGVDYIHAFLNEINLIERGSDSENAETFTDKNLLYGLINLFNAGSETTSSTMRWFILYMAKFEDTQKKVQTEIDKVVPRNTIPNFSERVKLPYLNAVIHEVMRIKTIVPFGIFHCTAQDTTIGGYRIPKETIVVSNIGECHFDKTYWKNPEQFLPDRFLLPDGSFNNNIESFIPFSIGKRECLGKAFAKMELFFFAGALLQNFTFKAGDKAELDKHLQSPTINVIEVPPPVKIIISERM